MAQQLSNWLTYLGRFRYSGYTPTPANKTQNRLLNFLWKLNVRAARKRS